MRQVKTKNASLLRQSLSDLQSIEENTIGWNLVVGKEFETLEWADARTINEVGGPME
jgi:hypothetical protein